MNEITKRMWARDLNLKKWATINGFNYNTVQAVVRKKIGRRQYGKSKQILEALVNQGFMTKEEKAKRAA